MMAALPDPHLVLDWRIRLWVFLPIALATALMAVLRHYVVALLVVEPKVTLINVRDASAIARASASRRSAHLVHRAQFEARRAYFSSPDGPLRKTHATSSSPMTALMNPRHLSNQVTAVLTSFVPQMILGAWARYSFGGFAVCRVPFPLSQRFRGMLQVGIEHTGQNLDVSYVSALSWYIINLFGNVAIVRLFLSVDTSTHPIAKRDGGISSMVAGLTSVFRGFNNARDAETSALQSLDYECALASIELSVVDSDPCSVASPFS
jgi:ER membrane protein complex subunit 3